MARILVAHDRDTTFAIEIVNPDPADDAHDAKCPRCPWAASKASVRLDYADEVMNAAIVHIDIDHPEV